MRDDIKSLNVAAMTIGRLAVSLLMILTLPFLVIVIGFPAGAYCVVNDWLDTFKRLWKEKP